MYLPLELLYTALASPYGLSIETDDIQAAEQLIIKMKKMDPLFHCIKFRPVSQTEFFLINGTKDEPLVDFLPGKHS